MQTLILVDISYYIYNRFWATHKWYKLNSEEEEFDKDYDWYKDEIFMKHYNNTFFKNIQNIATDSISKILWCRDCKNKDIWRHKYIADYKAHRQDNRDKQGFNCYTIFDYTYDVLLKGYIESHPNNSIHIIQNCEGDDIIATIAMKYKDKYNIKIIGNDHDYLQLCNGNNIVLYDINGTKINGKYGEGEKCLLAKIIRGDKSDNIPPCKLFRCSDKTILPNIDANITAINKICDKILLKEGKYISTDDNPTPPLDFSDLNEIEQRFYINMKIMNFTMIPQYYQTLIINNVKEYV